PLHPLDLCREFVDRFQPLLKEQLGWAIESEFREELTSLVSPQRSTVRDTVLIEERVDLVLEVRTLLHELLPPARKFAIPPKVRGRDVTFGNFSHPQESRKILRVFAIILLFLISEPIRLHRIGECHIKVFVEPVVDREVVTPRLDSGFAFSVLLGDLVEVLVFDANLFDWLSQLIDHSDLRFRFVDVDAHIVFGHGWYLWSVYA